jgi:predicted nucleic acid-binding protein
MTERGILDTSVLVADDVDVLPGLLGISAVSLAELHFGVLVAKTADARAVRLSRLTRVQQRFDALPVDEAVADSYGILAARVTRAGRRPGGRALDLLIAATAHAHGARLFTRNPRDLAGLDRLVEVVAVGSAPGGAG